MYGMLAGAVGAQPPTLNPEIRNNLARISPEDTLKIVTYTLLENPEMDNENVIALLRSEYAGINVSPTLVAHLRFRHELLFTVPEFVHETIVARIDDDAGEIAAELVANQPLDSPFRKVDLKTTVSCWTENCAIPLLLWNLNPIGEPPCSKVGMAWTLSPSVRRNIEDRLRALVAPRLELNPEFKSYVTYLALRGFDVVRPYLMAKVRDRYPSATTTFEAGRVLATVAWFFKVPMNLHNRIMTGAPFESDELNRISQIFGLHATMVAPVIDSWRANCVEPLARWNPLFREPPCGPVNEGTMMALKGRAAQQIKDNAVSNILQQYPFFSDI